jgi:hypothetical protein
MIFELFEPIIGYKEPTIPSGATPIGSAGRAPKKDNFEKKFDKSDEEEENLS